MDGDTGLIIGRTAAILVGGFYALVGVFGLHQARMNALLDRALAQISLKPTPRSDRIEGVYLYAGSLAVFLSGAALLFLRDWAGWLFLATALLQAAYLLWARTQPEIGVSGRAVFTYGLFLSATALALLLSHAGVLA